MTTPTQLEEGRILTKPSLRLLERGELFVALDAEAPNWAATDTRGARILSWVDGKRSVGEIMRLYSALFGSDTGRTWRDVHAFLRQALDRGLIGAEGARNGSYPGRGHFLQPSRLREFWIHLLQTCNLACTHCLVSSGPQGEKGRDSDFLLALIDQAHELGARRFFFTGGEPFVRPDIFALIRYVTQEKGAELVLLTNATLFEGPRREGLSGLDREKVKFQVSLDGASAAINDPIRGQGVFAKACVGLKALSGLGFTTSLTAVALRRNLKDLEGLPDLASRLGAKSIHLMWPHRRGRILKTESAKAFPALDELLRLARQTDSRARALGLAFDNVDSLRLRVNGRPGVKYDLGNACWESLCLFMDGAVYPSAALAGAPGLSLGDASKQTLRSLWLDSPVAAKFRAASLASRGALAEEPFRFLTGGGDIEHGYLFSSKDGAEGELPGEDPYYGLYVGLISDLMFELGESKKRRQNAKSGYNPPLLYHAMGEDSISCSEDAAAWLADGGETPVRLLHSNCVLSFDVEKPYRVVQEFYGHAAEQPQAELCCPVKYDESEVGHIPREVLERFYGCGSPMAQGGVTEGETVLDLGSGAGIDCFIAAKKVGPKGRVIGVDMTDRMLGVARRCQKEVAGRLGFDVVEFREGYLEQVPAADKSVDLVTSNCVINLSPDKKRVFAEIWRVLKDHGRLVVADIVADRRVPLGLQAHKELWGECLSGALSEEEFLTGLERAGFYGVCLLKKIFWKEVEGYRFYSITVGGFKFEKKDGCRFIGQKAVYLGPYKAVHDEEGHLFARGEAVDICTDTAAKLSAAPYAGQFQVLSADGSLAAIDAAACCAPGKDGGCC